MRGNKTLLKYFKRMLSLDLAPADPQKNTDDDSGTSGRGTRTPDRKELDASGFVDAEAKEPGRWGRKQELKSPANMCLGTKDPWGKLRPGDSSSQKLFSLNVVSD